MRYISLVVALVAACGEEEMSPKNGQSRNLGTIEVNNLGARVLINPADPIGKTYSVLRTELDVPQPLTLTLNAVPRPKVLPLVSAGSLSGFWLVSWGSGGGALENTIVLDSGQGIVLPLHGSQVDVSFVLTIAPTVPSSIVAMIAGGSHQTTSKITQTQHAVTGAGALFIALVPPYAKTVEVCRGLGTQAVTAIRLFDVAAVVLSENTWPANVGPFQITIPKDAIGFSAVNGGGAPMEVGAIFDLGI